MKRMFKKVSALVVAVSIVLNCILPNVCFANNNYGISKTKMIVGGVTFGVPDIETEVSFDDRWLIDNCPQIYNKNLAKFGLLLSIDAFFDSYANVEGDVSDKTLFLKELDFQDVVVKPIDDHGTGIDTDDLGDVVMGNRLVNKDGRLYRIIIVSVNGHRGESTWVADFEVGSDDENYYALTGEHPEWLNRYNHKSFDVTANRLDTLVKNYVDSLGDGDDVTNSYFITGHSRAGGIANILGAMYYDRGERVVAYTFATPRTTTIPASKTNGSYRTIFNLLNSADFVVNMPPLEWGFKRYGRDMIYNLMGSEYEDIRKMIKEMSGTEYVGANVDALLAQFNHAATDRKNYYETKDDSWNVIEEYDDIDRYNKMLDTVREARKTLHAEKYVDLITDYDFPIAAPPIFSGVDDSICVYDEEPTEDEEIIFADENEISEDTDVNEELEEGEIEIEEIVIDEIVIKDVDVDNDNIDIMDDVDFENEEVILDDISFKEVVSFTDTETDIIDAIKNRLKELEGKTNVKSNNVNANNVNANALTYKYKVMPRPASIGTTMGVILQNRDNTSTLLKALGDFGYIAGEVPQQILLTVLLTMITNKDGYSRQHYPYTYYAIVENMKEPESYAHTKGNTYKRDIVEPTYDAEGHYTEEVHCNDCGLVYEYNIISIPKKEGNPGIGQSPIRQGGSIERSGGSSGGGGGGRSAGPITKTLEIADYKVPPTNLLNQGNKDMTNACALTIDGATDGMWSVDAKGGLIFVVNGVPLKNSWVKAKNIATYNKSAGWYYLDANGVMLTGWHWIRQADGRERCYYFNPVVGTWFGAMVMNTTTDDGHVVNAAGEWTVNGVPQIR